MRSATHDDIKFPVLADGAATEKRGLFDSQPIRLKLGAQPVLQQPEIF